MTEAKKKLSLPGSPTGTKPVRERTRPPVRGNSSAAPRIKPTPPSTQDDTAPARPPRRAPDEARSPRSDEGRPRRPHTDEPQRPRPPRRDDDAPRPRAPRRDDGSAPRTGAPARSPRYETDRNTDRNADRNSDRPLRGRPEGARRDAPQTDAPYERRSRGADGLSRPRSDRPAFKPRPAPSQPQDPTGAVRLSKRMTELGLCSRREADEYIERGWVKVDGKVVDELGSKIQPEQKIELTRLAADTQTKRVTVILNKPIGYVSGQAEDGHEPAAVLITNENHWSEDPIKRPFEARLIRKLAPAGRLDIDSAGMLVLTQDGRIAKHLIGEDSDIEKEYLVRVEGPLSYDDLALLNHGLMLDGIELQPAKVSWQNEHQLRFVLREGRKRQIRRMCELVGLRVTALKRIRIGSINLAKLPPGQWRYLGDHEKF